MVPSTATNLVPPRRFVYLIGMSRSSPPQPTGVPDSRIFYGYVIVAAAFAAQFIAVGAQTGVIGAFAKPMTEALGWSRTELFLAETVGQVTMAVVGVALGPRVDRLGARRLMLAGVTITVPALVLISQVDTLWQWVLLRGLLFVVGAALVSSLVVSVTVSKWFVLRRGQALGAAAMGVSLAGVVWPPLATVAINGLGWRGALIPAALVMRRQPEDYGLQPDGRASQSTEARALASADYENSLTRGEAVRTQAFYVIVVAFGLSIIGIFAILTQTIPFLTDAGFSTGTAALMSSTMSISALVTKAPWGWALDRFQARFLAAWSFVIAAVGLALVVVAASGGSIAWLVVGYLLTGVGVGGNIPIHEVVWASYFGRRHLGAVRSAGFPFTAAIAAATPLGLAWYFDSVGNYDGALLGCGALWVLAAILVLFLRRPKPRATTRPAAAYRPLVGRASPQKTDRTSRLAQPPR